MKRYCTYQRLIAIILMILVLGVQVVNGLSNSHSQIAHRHGAANGQASKAHSDHGHGHLAAKAKPVHAHVHSAQHDPGDHTHDLPLRPVLAVVQLSFMPTWHAEAGLAFRSVVVHPLERPPKSAVLASLA